MECRRGETRGRLDVEGRQMGMEGSDRRERLGEESGEEEKCKKRREHVGPGRGGKRKKKK